MSLTAEDRFGIFDALAHYAWCMDTGDIEGLIATFTADATIKDAAGTLWDARNGGARGFAEYFLNQPNRRGAQHHFQHRLVEDAGGGMVRVRSYWFSLRWDTALGDEKVVRGLGEYIDTYAKGADRWLIKEKVINRWNSDTSPVFGQ